MKKFFAFLIAGVILLQGISVFAADSDGSGNVEISFRLGDSVLKINGAEVKVETPFEENGATLVPLRVITEAFGADVFWNGETKQVTINYGDTTISLKIGDINAYVNGQKQTLLLAPRIVNGSTMVPLRFVTETFGANVKWNDADSSILVTFSGAITGTGTGPIDDITSVLKGSNKARIGNSYQKWSIDMPTDMVVDYQSFDGRSVSFISETEDVAIYIDSYENSDNLTLAQLKVKESQYMKEYYTFVGQETKTTKSGVSYISTQGKDRSEFTQSNVYLRGADFVVVDTFMDISVTGNERQKYLDIADSFDFTFDAATTEDMSDVVDGYRLFNDKTLNVQFRMPADWYDYSDYNSENNFRFVKLDKDYNELAYVSLNVYSISDFKTALEWAQSEYNYAKQLLNPSMATFSQITPVTVSGQQGYSFTVTIKENGKESVIQDILLFYEGYAYDFKIKTGKNETAVKEKIINSFKVSKIDADKVGKFAIPLYETDDVMSTYENKNAKYKVTVPTSWYSYGASMFEEQDSMMMMTIETNKTTSDDFAQESITEAVDLLKSTGVKIKNQKKSNKVNNEIVEISGIVTMDQQSLYVQVNVFTRGDLTFVVMTMIPELAFTDAIQNKIYKAINSIEIIK